MENDSFKPTEKKTQSKTAWELAWSAVATSQRPGATRTLPRIYRTRLGACKILRWCTSPPSSRVLILHTTRRARVSLYSPLSVFREIGPVSAAPELSRSRARPQPSVCGQRSNAVCEYFFKVHHSVPYLREFFFSSVCGFLREKFE